MRARHRLGRTHDLGPGGTEDSAAGERMVTAATKGRCSPKLGLVIGELSARKLLQALRIYLFDLAPFLSCTSVVCYRSSQVTIQPT